jgi:pyruvate formate lyase activating enzyme
MVYPHKCIHCNLCIEACTKKAITLGGDKSITTDRSKCITCGKCTQVCSTGARVVCGKSYSAQELFVELLKDEVFFRNTCGGVTLSGGDFILYPHFVSRLFLMCEQRGIHTAIETSGFAEWGRFAVFNEHTDLFLYDLKSADSALHRKWTGVDNMLILSNLRRLAEAEKHIIARVCLVPGVNDSAEEFGGICSFLRSLPRVPSIHILPFHQIGSSKYEALDLNYPLSKLNETDPQLLDRCRSIAEGYGLEVCVGGSGLVSEIPKNTKTNRGDCFVFQW